MQNKRTKEKKATDGDGGGEGPRENLRQENFEIKCHRVNKP